MTGDVENKMATKPYIQDCLGNMGALLIYQSWPLPFLLTLA